MRFSTTRCLIVSMLLLPLVFCGSVLSSSLSHERIAEYRRTTVGRILYSDASDAEKLQQLRRYVRMGTVPSEQLARAAGFGRTISIGVGFGETMFIESGLELRVYPDGVVYGIGYTIPGRGTRSDQTYWLITQINVHWPRNSKNPSYYLHH